MQNFGKLELEFQIWNSNSELTEFVSNQFGIPIWNPNSKKNACCVFVAKPDQPDAF
jgi:hypothetical protein